MKQAKELHKKVPDDYDIILKKALEHDYLKSHKIIFSWFPNHGSRFPTANTSLCNTIRVNAEYAARLVLFNDEATWNSYYLSVGHELTHSFFDPWIINHHGKNKKFVSWVRELHADYGAAQKMSNSNREKLIQGLKYKAKLKTIDEDSKSHPSWKRRIQYVSVFDFDDTLIKQVAKDVGCQNKKIIKKQCESYTYIYLK